MPDKSREQIEEYCFNRHSKKSQRLQDLLYKTYDPNTEFTKEDLLFIDELVYNEGNPKMLKALQDLYDYLSRHAVLQTE